MFPTGRPGEEEEEKKEGEKEEEEHLGSECILLCMKQRHDTQVLVSSRTFAPTYILENAIIHSIHIRRNPQQLFLAAKIATLHQEDKNNFFLLAMSFIYDVTMWNSVSIPFALFGT